MGGRNLLPLDQAEPQDQDICRTERKCRPDSDLCRLDCLLAPGTPQIQFKDRHEHAENASNSATQPIQQSKYRGAL